MAQFDKNAVDATELRIKLRHGESNAKLPRTPYNLEQAIVALFHEALDLSGEESAYRVMRELAQAFAFDKGWIKGEHPTDQTQLEMDIAAGIEMLVNMWRKSEEAVSGEQVAAKIVSELRDTELVTKESLAAFIE